MLFRFELRTFVTPAIALLQFQLVFAQIAPPIRTGRPAVADTSTIASSPTCQTARSTTDALLTELQSAVPAAIRGSIEQASAKPGPGVSAAKAYGDAAAAYMLVGNHAVAAWAGLKAAQISWSGETVANAGVYLFHFGKTEDAKQFLLCAYSSGNRSPYLLEALAVVHQAGGNTGDARRYINEAAQAEPNDVMIETEASYINTGGPPPSRPPRPEPDSLDEAIAELEAHANRATRIIKSQADAIDQAIPDAKAREVAQISIDYISKQVPMAREQARAARSTPAAGRPMMITTALSMYISMYAQISDTMLSFLDTTEINGSPILVWSDVVRIDPPALQREQEGGWKEPIRWSMHGQGVALSQPPLTTFTKDKEAGYRDHNAREDACRDNPCRVRENARWCGVRSELFRRWEDASRQRHNAAARRFDQVATRYVIAAENEYLQLRDYAVRQIQKMKFPPPVQGMSLEKLTIDAINTNLKLVYDKHLAAETNGGIGMATYLRDRAKWFETERTDIDEMLKIEAEDIRTSCEAPMREFLELLAQEEWQAYLDHLRDRLSWSVQPKNEGSFPCETSIGPLTIEADLNKPGEGKMDLKWKGKTFSGGGNVVFGPGGPTFGAGGSAKTSGVTLTGGVDSSGNAGTGGGFGYGPFQGKAKVSYTSKVSPWNNREYLGIKLKGSAGLGLSNGPKGQLGMKCFPSSGSVTIYPRAFYEDAVKYLSTPSSAPGRTPR